MSGTWFNVTCGACPLQIEGEIYDHPFFYRSRWGFYRIAVVGPGEQPIGATDPLVCLEGRGGDTWEQASAIILDAGIRLGRILTRREATR